MESILVAMAVMVVAQANPEAKRLYDDLLSNYNRLIRPVGNNSDRLTVKLGLKLSQLIDVSCNNARWLCRDSPQTCGSRAASLSHYTADCLY